MAKQKKSKGLTIFVSIVVSILGVCVGLILPLYVMQNYFTKNITTDKLIITEEVFYSKGDSAPIHSDVEIEGSDLSVHFLELGNKYTGDCTYIKVGENIDILIDCGSKTTSISTVKEYLDNFVTDGTLEYVIITHAHQDHYAGFATSTKIKSIFDYYECGTIIKFANTNQTTSTMYQNFLRELGDEDEAGATVYTAKQCYEQTNGAQREYHLTSNTSLEILYNKYYTNHASSENDYSVCCMLKNGNHKFLFTGDLEAEGEAYLAEQYLIDHPEDVNLEVDLYKAGHHGSKTSSSIGFLNVFRPKVCCVCCCAGSPEYTKTVENQFPTQTFINNIAKHTEFVFVTTLCIDYNNNEYASFNGNIVLILKDDQIGIDCSNNKTVLKDTEWFKNNRTCPTEWLSS